ncbi:HNH endonuclease signature motif containing protein [Blastococcus saxobsidens]|uniref:HNH endonuclease n=1 Tax=Blastococcus saxobsidens (strain DD2) TaxID=1146883 RepID=H6RT28_BLASD|nr:HNH endonuclease signature motif containing protein [Blastococcus saxobsidens]CCG04331.1 HNH endonuclease [Blastococcus saxobsidens DD2]
MSELQSALDALAADDVRSLPPRQQLDEITELLEARNRIDAQLARRVRAAELQQAPEDDGMRSMQSWLRGRGRLSAAAAGQLVRNGRALDHLPALAAAFAEGAVTAEQVAVVAPVVKEDRRTAALALGVDLADLDEVFTAVAASRDIRQLGRVVQHYLARLDPDGPEPDPTEERGLTLSTFSDGTVVIRGQLDAVGGEKLQAALEAVVQADRPKGDLRTRAQQLADALVQLADNQLASGHLPFLRTVKPTVVVTITSTDLFDPAPGPASATTAFGSLLSAAKVRQLACDGSVVPVLVDGDGLPLDMGRTKRVYPPHLRRAVELRDDTCVFAGCGAPKYWCEVHHLIHWLFGGETSLENGALLCERHHTNVHHGFRIERDSQGRWHTYRPDGTEILIGTALAS